MMFSNFFNVNKDNQSNKYQQLLDSSEWTNILEKSYKVPQIIFKHSERCSISRWVLKHFENAFKLDKADGAWYLIDVVSKRDLSQKMARDVNIIHESPQLLILNHGQCIYDASHESISYEKVDEIIYSIKSV